MVGRHLVNSQKIAVRYIGQVSADSQSIYWSRVLSVCIVFSPGEEIGAKLLKYEPIALIDTW